MFLYWNVIKIPSFHWNNIQRYMVVQSPVLYILLQNHIVPCILCQKSQDINANITSGDCLSSPHGLFHLSPAFWNNSMRKKLRTFRQQSPRSSEQSNSSICKIKAKATEFTTRSSIPGALTALGFSGACTEGWS